jgi:hypothetical protein
MLRAHVIDSNEQRLATELLRHSLIRVNRLRGWPALILRWLALIILMRRTALVALRRPSSVPVFLRVIVVMVVMVM